MDEKKRQQKLQKKRKKDKQRHKKLANSGFSARDSANPKTIIANARNFPVKECLISADWQEEGLTQILIAREQPDGNLLFGVYLVDLLCLGLKNTFYNCNFSVREYMEFRSRFAATQEMVQCPLDMACQIIYGAIEYAADLGFQPQRDFELSQYILEQKNGLSGNYRIEYGRDGKPFYVAGPNDNVEFIMRKLEEKLGRDQYHFLVGEAGGDLA
jgi:hypothetical protein